MSPASASRDAATRVEKGAASKRGGNTRDGVRHTELGAGPRPGRYIAFPRFYIGPNSGFGPTQRVERLAEEARSLGYEWVQCSTEGAYPKIVVDAHIIMDILTWSYCHSVDVTALYSGDGD
jgi:hypothetical protein